MEENKVLSKAADTLLDEPKDLSYDIKPKSRIHAILQQWGWMPKKRTVQITGSTLGTMIRLSKLLLSIDITPMPQDRLLDWSYEQIESGAPVLARVIAAAIHNKKSQVPESLVNEIMDNFTAQELLATSQIIIGQIDIMAFLTTIRSVRSASLLQQPELSLEKPEEIIASGEQSIQASNIFASATRT